jgi:hypothetical protein
VEIELTHGADQVTPIIGQTENGLKTTQSTLKVLPEVVIYDVDLTLGLPFGMTVTSGFNAIAHAVEALYSKDNNPIIDQFACWAFKRWSRLCQSSSKIPRMSKRARMPCSLRGIVALVSARHPCPSITSCAMCLVSEGRVDGSLLQEGSSCIPYLQEALSTCPTPKPTR